METKRITALQRTALFGCLTEKELADISQRAVEFHFTKGEMLFLSGEEAKWLFVVVSGKIRVFLQNLEGREQVMHVDTAGSVLADDPVQQFFVENTRFRSKPINDYLNCLMPIESATRTKQK